MAPYPPLSGENTSENTDTNTAINTSATIPCSCLLSSAFLRHSPFSSSSRSKPSNPAPPNMGADLVLFQTHMVSAMEKFTTALSDAACRSPFLKSIVSLHDHVQSFCQIRFRNENSPNLQEQNCLSSHNFAAILPGDSVGGLVVANGISNFLNLYNTLLVVRLVLTWFPGAPPAIVNPLSTLCDPYLNIFRGIIPPLGGTLDLSPILAFLVLNAFTSTAAALPAELPASMTSRHKVHSFQWLPLNLTTVQQKWMRRMSSKQNKST